MNARQRRAARRAGLLIEICRNCHSAYEGWRHACTYCGFPPVRHWGRPVTGVVFHRRRA